MKYEVKKMCSKISDNHNKQSCSKVNFVDTGKEFELRRLLYSMPFYTHPPKIARYGLSGFSIALEK